MALRALIKQEIRDIHKAPSTVKQLYRSMIRELPRVLALYDIDIQLKDAKTAIRFHFRKNEHVEDGRIISILLAKGHMEFEETIMHWKQKPHLLRILQPVELQPKREMTTLETLLNSDGDEEIRW